MGQRCAHSLASGLVAIVVAAVGCGGSDGSSSSSHGGIVTPAPTALATPIPTATPADVAAGVLDPTFGTDGVVLLSMQRDLAVVRYGLRVLPDGTTEVLVVDQSGFFVHPVTSLFRFSADGLHVENEIVGASIAAETVAFDARGDVWIAGRFDGLRSVARVPRGSDGLNDVHTHLALSIVSDLVPLPDGGVLAVGRAGGASALERFAADGSVDLAFGTDGVVVDPPRADERSNAYGTAAAADGRILVAGTQFTQGLAFFPIVLAFDGAGNPDAAYGDDGVVVLGSVGGAYAIAAAPDGTAVVAVNTSGLVRFDPRGVRDPEYTARSVDIAGGAALGLTPRQSLVAAGASFIPDEPRRFDCGNSSGGVCLRLAPSVSRLGADGTPDARFGGTGTVVTDSAPPNGAQGTGYSAFALVPAHRITAAGTACRAPFVCDVVVARYGDVDE